MNILKKTMKIQSVTQAEISRKMGVTKQAVNNWTRGISLPSPKYMKKLSDYLKVSIDKLFFNDEQ